MSLTTQQYKQTLRKDQPIYFKLIKQEALGLHALQWMAANNKGYALTTLAKFNVQQGIVERYDKRLGSGRRGYVCSEPCIIIPAGPILRVYRYMEPTKQTRWSVSPPGYRAQWIGDRSKPEVILHEGEWDCFRSHDQGFDNAISHTAGSMTWLDEWTALFAGKRCWICYDRDLSGRKGAAKVARILSAVAKEVRIIDLPLPGTPDKKDVSDFFRDGGTRHDFAKLINSARHYIPSIR